MIEITRTEQGGTQFFLHTKSAILALLASAGGFLFLPYWGARLKANDISYVVNEIPFVSYMAETEGNKDFQLVTFVQIQAKPNMVSKRLQLRGLDPDGWYQINGGAVRSGGELMHIGLDVGNVREDAFSRRWLLTRTEAADRLCVWSR